MHFLFKTVYSIIGILFLFSGNISASKIWDKAPHSAFTSLMHHNGYFYCAFREGFSHNDRNDHPNTNGRIRVIRSNNGIEWESYKYFQGKGDLRDPSLSVSPDGRLILLFTEVIFSGKKPVSLQTMVSDLESALFYSDFKPINIVSVNGKKISNRWLWKTTWHKNYCYGVAYGGGSAILVVSNNGYDFSVITNLNVEGYLSEASIVFDKLDRMLVALRRDGNELNTGMLGISMPPYIDFEWKDSGIRFGGPSLYYDTIRTILATRDFTQRGIRTALYTVDTNLSVSRLIELKSAGDCSYPSLITVNDSLYISYYSSHEGGKASIYLSIIPVSRLNEPDLK